MQHNSLSKMKIEMKTFPDKQKLKDSITSKPALQEILESRVFQVKMKGH
jgi:hypothetical protein